MVLFKDFSPGWIASVVDVLVVADVNCTPDAGIVGTWGVQRTRPGYPNCNKYKFR